MERREEYDDNNRVICQLLLCDFPFVLWKRIRQKAFLWGES